MSELDTPILVREGNHDRPIQHHGASRLTGEGGEVDGTGA